MVDGLISWASFKQPNNCRIETNYLDAGEIRPKCGFHIIRKF